MVTLEMGIWAGIAAGGVMFMLLLIPVLGCMFSRSKKAKKATELEESAAEKGEFAQSAPVPAPAPTRPVNAILQKPAMQVSQYEFDRVRTQPSTQSMSPSYQSQASTLSPLGDSTPSPPHMQPIWTKPSP